jgi:Ca2+-binding RTX toxin-like protein
VIEPTKPPVTAEPKPTPTLNGVTKTGTASNDRLLGTAGNDKIAALAGNDHVQTGGGNDTIIGGAGADTMVGGLGLDTASYETATAGVTADLANASLNLGDARGDVYFGMENLLGSAHADTLRGNVGMNHIDGGAGDDRLFGFEGMDTLVGGSGNDRLEGGINNDLLIGGLGNDTLVGGADRDTFFFQSRNDGFDTIVDFQRGFDKIKLGADFGFSATNPIKLVAAGAAMGSGPTLVYHQGTGVLSYDADGSGAGLATRIADLTDGLALGLSDFLL